jgi:hypothetical protein
MAAYRMMSPVGWSWQVVVAVAAVAGRMAASGTM